MTLNTGAGRWLGSAMLLVALAGCGGGGGGDSAPAPAPTTRQPLPQLVQDIEPAGEPVDVAANDFFAVAAGDKAIYGSGSGVNQIDVQREVTVGPDADGRFTVVESVPGSSTIVPEVERWQRRAEGLVAFDVLGDDAPPGVKALLGELLVFPTPFRPVGSVRRLVRQGSFGADLDGDGRNESFRFEFSQLFVGFSTGTRAGRPEKRAQFRNTITLTIETSRADVPPVTVVEVEQPVFAEHTGLISMPRSALVDGVEIQPHNGPTLLKSGTLGGRDVTTAWNAATTKNLALRHYDLVYEPLHKVYYAGTAHDDTRGPGAVARIDPATGGVAFSEPLGGDVRSIAVAADGSTLYAGVFGRAEIVRLSLPDLAVVQRMPIAAGTWAFSLAVSPVDRGTLAYWGDNFGQLTLLRDGVAQPRTPAATLQPFQTSARSAFAADGSALFVVGQVGGVPGHYRVPVLADGLGDASPKLPGTLVDGSLSVTAAGLVAANNLVRTSDLGLVGSIPGTGLGACKALPVPSRWVCAPTSSSLRQIAVVDAAAFTVVGDPLPFVSPAPGGIGAVVRVEPGPAGQVAVMLGSDGLWFGTWVVLYDDPLYLSPPPAGPN